MFLLLNVLVVNVLAVNVLTVVLVVVLAVFVVLGSWSCSCCDVIYINVLQFCVEVWK